MYHTVQPIVGHWYWHCESDQLLEVIYLDAIRGDVDVQDESGVIFELRAEEWQNAHLIPTDLPSSFAFDLEDELVDADSDAWSFTIRPVATKYEEYSAAKSSMDIAA